MTLREENSTSANFSVLVKFGYTLVMVYEAGLVFILLNTSTSFCLVAVGGMVMRTACFEF